jgi:hypothetical protein
MDNAIFTNTGLMMLYQQAKQDYDIALEQFNNAEQEYSEVAIYRLKASKTYLDILIKQIKAGDKHN